MTPTALSLSVTVPPLAAFVFALVGMRGNPRAAQATTLAAGALSLVGAAALLAGGAIAHPIEARWMSLDGADLAFGYLLDGPNLLMGTLVAGIAFLVQVYSVGYMAHDRGRPRYFALLAFFAWSMLSFVYSSNLLQMFLFWELVGLASFFLIGFWYEKPAAAAAGRKAFLMTRVGDVGLFLGLILLWQETRTLDLVTIIDPATIAGIEPGRLTAIGLLLFLGVAGKSAQFPLHTWLPDAMEGPTPVSALLHSATMVAAGVFLFARFLPVFLASSTVTVVVLAVALFTAILAATIAMVSRDIKRVLAYSSISQLSFMLLGLAAGSLGAGLFHLVTHACFKALLFLCAGAYIHHLGSNDAVTIGRAGGRSMRWTTAGLVTGGAALAGVPPFAGFFSKEAILHAVGATGRGWLVVGIYFAVFLTAYYTFRLVFLVTRPNEGSALVAEAADLHAAGAGPAGAAGAAHGAAEAPPVMLVPIGILTGFALGVGFAGSWILDVIHGPAAHVGTAAGPAHGRGVDLAAALPAVATTLAGIGLAWLDFGRAGAAQTGFLARLPALHTLFERKWYVDELYGTVVGGTMTGVARLAAAIEVAVLDASGDLVGAATRLFGRAASRLQNGQVQRYIGTAVFVVAGLGWLLVRAGGTP